MAADASKLDSLVEKIYKEGLEKSNQEADAIRKKAEDDAARIREDAKKEAEAIINDAKEKGEEITRNTLAELKLASEQAISTLKQRIKDLITQKVMGDTTKAIFVDEAFLKELIIEIAKKWDVKEGFAGGIDVCLPESMKAKMSDAFTASLTKSIENLTVSFDKKRATGFTIAPKDSTFQVTFTDEDFIAFFKPYIKQKTEEIIFAK